MDRRCFIKSAVASAMGASAIMVSQRTVAAGLAGHIILPMAEKTDASPNGGAMAVNVATGDKSEVSAHEQGWHRGINYHHATDTTEGILVVRQDGADIQRLDGGRPIIAPNGVVFGGHAEQRSSDGLLYAAANIISPEAKKIRAEGVSGIDRWGWLKSDGSKFKGIGCVLAIDPVTGDVVRVIQSGGTQTHDLKIVGSRLYVNHYGVARQANAQRDQYESWYARREDGSYDIVDEASVSEIDIDFGGITKIHGYGKEAGACNHFAVSDGAVIANFFDMKDVLDIPNRMDFGMGAAMNPAATINAHQENVSEFIEEMAEAGLSLMPHEVETGQIDMAMTVAVDAGSDRSLIPANTRKMRRQQSICRDPMTGRVFQTNSGSGTITMINAGRLKFQHINTRDWGVEEPRGIAFDGKGHGAVVDARHGIAFFDTTTFEKVHYLDIDIANGVHATWIT